MGEEESKHATVRWIDAVRYAVAGVVTALAVAVIASAIVQSLRPEVLHLSVANGYVSVGEIKSMSTTPVSVRISFKLEATNPRGRATILYNNVTVHFLYNTSSSGTEVTYIYLADNKLFVAPHIQRNLYLAAKFLQAPADVDMEFVKKMFNKQEINNAMVVVEGTMMQTKNMTSALNNTSGRYTKYSCFPVAIGTSPYNEIDQEDVTCVVV